MTHDRLTSPLIARPRDGLWADNPMCSASGFSLIEVLISIVVLSFGLLGMVGMQAAALQANREARLQSSAVILARELAEMIRGNKDIGLRTANNPYLGQFDAALSTLAATTPSYCLSVGATKCADEVSVANAEMTEWLARVDAQLPGARVDTCFDSAPFDVDGLPKWECTAGTDGVVVVKIGWTRGTTNHSKTDSDEALERARIPSVVFPVTAGNAL